MTKEQRECILPVLTAFLTRPDNSKHDGWKWGAECLLDGLTVVFPWRDERYHEYSAFERDGYFIVWGHDVDDKRITTEVLKVQL